MTDTKAPATVEFHYGKSGQFRTVHADGIFGGATPTGNIHMTVYSERFAIPKKVVLENEGNKIGKELSREGLDGVWRELEVGIVMSPELAVSLRDWLTEHLKKFEEVKPR
ncbi:MAG TPA: hypothetical protein VH062_00750 [Polyangiaceae bacterium]|nr:hypothetical protein [Polyangiaceae bacterium]